MLLRTRWLGWRHVHLRAHLRLLHGDEWAERRRACQRRAIGRDNAVLQPLRWTSGLCDAALPECELLPPEYETAPTEDLGISTSSDIITEVDNFARARVSNFIKRVEPHNRLGVESSMEVREVEGDEGVLHVARLRLPLPPEYGHRYGEGFARQPKDAEKVAAMHAERVIDALGFSIFGLPSKQQRHAEAARAVGRWAPLPNDAPRPPTTPSPPSLCLRHGSDGEKRKQDLRMDPRGFSNVSPAATVHPLRWTVASPHFMDRGSERRLRNFFESYQANFQRYCRITPLSSGEGAAPNTTLFLAQIRLPIPPRFSERVCMGRAPTKRDAVALACMHAELTIDVLGLALYPGNRERQVAHAEECRRVGRWCAGPDECDYRYDAVAPPPLQLAATPASDAACPVAGSAEAVPSSIEATLTQASIGTTQRRQGGVQEAEMQRAGEHSVESVLVLHSKAVAAMHRVVDVTEVDPHGRSVILHHLSHVAGIHAGAATSQFYVEALGLKDHQTFRATITVPLTLPGTESERAEDFFVAVGIARSATEAEAAASAHALLVLHHLHRRVEGMAMEEHTTFLRHLGVPASTLLDVDGTPRGVADLPAGAIPPPIRCCRDHIGRITAPGLAATTRRQRRFVADGPSAAETMHSREEVVVREVLQRRRLAPRAEWSLEADGDHRIVVSPHATPSEAKGYVHTLSAVRSPDDMAVQRLRDYLERHGQRLESSVQRTVLDVEEDGREGGAPVQLHIVRVVLPVSTRWEVLDKEQHAPATAGRCVAIGEAFTEPDALVMCAMHAELLLDALCYQMYDHTLLQRKHSDTARMLGRWAPLAAGALPPIALQVTPPPPLRKERSSSCLWARVEQQQVTQRSSGENPTLTEQCVADGDHLMEQTDDELCDLSRLQHAPHPWLAAQKHVRAYFDKRNGSLERSMRQYSVMTPDHGPVHRAIVEIPVPSVYGKRYGVGCATNKRVAYRACLMHVLLVLDALGLPVYSGSKQKELVKHAAAVGLSQPSPGLPIKPGDSPSPAGLCTFRVDSNQLLELPTPPSTTEVDNNPQSWLAYVRACRTYMGQAREDHQNQALFQRRHAPRSGIPVEDDGLDRVEALPVHYGARARLLRLATRLGLSALEDFRYETFGRAPSKAFLTEVAVHGTPYTARGYGSTSQESIQRAAMHYEHLLTTTVIQAAGRRPAAAAIGGGAKLSSGAASRRPTHSGGPAATSECKRLALALYAIARSPFLPLQVSLRDGATSSDLPTKMVVAELRGEHGVTWSGRSELPASSCTESRAGAFQAAVVQALEQLQEHAMRHASYQAYLHFASHHPKVRVETLSQASSMEGRMEDLLPGGVMGSSDTAVDELVTVPLHLDERFPGNHTTHALLDYVERRLQQSVTPPPMVVPAPILSRLVGCGMAEAHLNTNDGDDATGGEVVVTAQGVSCAFLLQCLPPFPLFSKTPTRPDDSGVPLPIASHGDVFILQLARLLLAGLAFGCPDAAARLVALAASAPEVCTGEGGSVDLVDLATGAPSISSFPAADGYEEEVLKRLTSLKHHVRTHAPHSAFATLLQQQPIQKMELSSATVSESLKWQMRLCVAFASFPSYWLVDQDRTIMRSFSTISGTSSVPLVSTDGRTSTHVTCATADVAMKHVHCRPLFASLDCLVREGPGTRPNAGVAAVGAFTHPAQSLAAAVVGSTTAEGLTVVVDLDNVALLYGGTVPLMARDGCSSIVACHDQLAHHLSALRSPPHGLQRMLRRLCGEVE